MFKKLFSILLTTLLVSNLAACACSPIQSEKVISLDEKIGQMLCLDFRYWNDGDSQKPVTEINDEIRKVIAKYHIGGVILFAQNFVNKEQAKKLIEDLQKTAIDSGNPPLIIAVDQEGGRVERFSFGRERLKNNADIKTSEEAFEKGKFIATELKDLGINCNFAPVVDINSNPLNPVINVRSFGNNADIVSEFGQKFLEGLHSQNIIGVAKHFPGHGDTSVDSHFELPTVNKTLEELETLELKPFKALVNSGIDMIMTAHIELPQIDQKNAISKKDGSKIYVPATLSKVILKDILREKLDFKGVTISDAMNMKAISENFGECESAKMAINAGIDILLMPVILRSKKDVDKLEELINYIKSSVNNEEISEKDIDQSVERILKLKKKYCNFLL